MSTTVENWSVATPAERVFLSVVDKHPASVRSTSLKLEQLCLAVGQPFLIASLQWAYCVASPRSFSHAHAIVIPLELDRIASPYGSSCDLSPGAASRKRSRRSTSQVGSDETARGDTLRSDSPMQVAVGRPDVNVIRVVIGRRPRVRERDRRSEHWLQQRHAVALADPTRLSTVRWQKVTDDAPKRRGDLRRACMADNTASDQSRRSSKHDFSRQVGSCDEQADSKSMEYMDRVSVQHAALSVGLVEEAAEHFALVQRSAIGDHSNGEAVRQRQDARYEHKMSISWRTRPVRSLQRLRGYGSR